MSLRQSSTLKFQIFTFWFLMFKWRPVLLLIQLLLILVSPCVFQFIGGTLFSILHVLWWEHSFIFVHCWWALRFPLCIMFEVDGALIVTYLICFLTNQLPLITFGRFGFCTPSFWVCHLFFVLLSSSSDICFYFDCHFLSFLNVIIYLSIFFSIYCSLWPLVVPLTSSLFFPLFSFYLLYYYFVLRLFPNFLFLTNLLISISI